MLFRASITKDIIRDEDKLVEQFYIFLEDFVVYKLRYESRDTQDDCIQDTIMMLVQRARNLTDQEIQEINLEQYFYNKANSYISSIFLGKLNRYRSRIISVDAISKTISDDTFNNTSDQLLSINVEKVDYSNYFLDVDLLKELIEEYGLEPDDRFLVFNQSLEMLETIGFLIEEPIKELPYSHTLQPIVTAVADEYVLQIIKRN